VNTIGAIAVGVYGGAAILAIACFFDYRLADLVKAHGQQPVWLWPDKRARRRFLIFVGLCALGPLSAAVGFLYGGWPTN
jgi:hypothetical protein